MYMHTEGGIFKRKEEGGDSSNAIVCCHEVIILWLIEKEKEILSGVCQDVQIGGRTASD